LDPQYWLKKKTEIVPGDTGGARTKSGAGTETVHLGLLGAGSGALLKG
jgi:hypothetical protein